MKHRPFPLPPSLFAAAAVIVLLISTAAALNAEPIIPEHGSLDVFSKDGISLAWVILRDKAGIDPENDDVVLRLSVSPSAALAFTAEGIDPFSGERTTIASGRLSEKNADIHFKRSHFSQYPKTEIFFFGTAEPVETIKAVRMIYFMGLPDTTPEFISAEKMETYLEERLAQINR